MKAAVLFGNEDIRYTDIKMPETRQGTVKIRVRASGICGSDVPRVFAHGAHSYPIVLGHEFSGEVAEVGEGVADIAVGDRVTAAPRIPCLACEDCLAGNIAQCKHDSFIGSREQGSFAEYVVVPARNVVRFSKSVPFEVAAFFEPATVALHGVQNVGFEGGGYAAVVGAGTIGNLAMQWTKIFGSRKTVVFDLDDRRLALAKEMGADAVVNTAKESWFEEATALTDGRGYADVFEVVGANPTLVMALRLAGAKARVSLIGTPPGSVTFTKEQWEHINRKELWIRGCWQGYSMPFPGREWELTAHYFATQELRITEKFIDKKFPLKDAAQAFELFQTPERVHGKILLVND